MSNPFLKLDPASRREFMLRTAKTAFGVSVLTHFDQAFGASSPVQSGIGGKAKSVIYLYMAGGMSHIDTWDPKTGETKGGKDPIKTKAGFELGGYMTEMAKVADKISIVRSMSSKTGVHEAGSYVMHTGYDPRGTILHPTLGSWAQHFLGRSHKTLPSSVVIGAGEANAGFFPPALAPVPISSPDSGLQNVRSSVGEDGLKKRMALMNEFDSSFREKFKSSDVKAYTEFYDETMNLLASSDLKAFSLSDVDSATKSLYGTGGFSKGCMLASRLVQSGVRFVEVRLGGWDMHNYVDQAMGRVGAEMDKGFAALITDLKNKGLLDSTLVIMGSEFGRTPRINENSGRDHYPKAYSTVFAGGGIKAGYIHGSTDKDGKEVTDKQATCQDFIATVGAAMGLPISEVVMSPSGRPFTVGDKGTAITELFA
jgi:hypothetical protein